MNRFRIVYLDGIYQVQYPFRFPFSRNEKWYPCLKWGEGPVANFWSLIEAEAFVSHLRIRQGHGEVVKEYGK